MGSRYLFIVLYVFLEHHLSRGDYRRGLKAAAEHHVRHPLQEAEFTKADVRALAQEWGLPTWDKPQLACLSSRFPYGTHITRERLAMVDRFEDGLRDLGFVLINEIIWSKDGTGGRWGSANHQRPIFGSYPYPPNFLFKNVHEYVIIVAKPSGRASKGKKALPYAELMQLPS